MRRARIHLSTLCEKARAKADDRAYFLAVMPPEVTQQLVPVVWKDEWASIKPFLLD